MCTRAYRFAIIWHTKSNCIRYLKIKNNAFFCFFLELFYGLFLVHKVTVAWFKEKSRMDLNFLFLGNSINCFLAIHGKDTKKSLGDNPAPTPQDQFL